MIMQQIHILSYIILGIWPMFVKPTIHDARTTTTKIPCRNFIQFINLLWATYFHSFVNSCNKPVRWILFPYFTVEETKAQTDQIRYPRSHSYLSGKIIFLSFCKNPIATHNHHLLVKTLLQPWEKYGSVFYLQLEYVFHCSLQGTFLENFLNEQN